MFTTPNITSTYLAAMLGCAGIIHVWGVVLVCEILVTVFDKRCLYFSVLPSRCRISECHLHGNPQSAARVETGGLVVAQHTPKPTLVVIVPSQSSNEFNYSIYAIKCVDSLNPTLTPMNYSSRSKA